MNVLLFRHERFTHISFLYQQVAHDDDALLLDCNLSDSDDDDNVLLEPDAAVTFLPARCQTS